MSTPNFERMNFNLPMVCGRTAAQMVEDYGEEFTETDYYFESQFDFERAEELAENFSRDLTFHTVEIKGGYYDNFQFYVDETYSKWFDLDKSSEYCISNEDAHYYFDMCRSVAIRKADAEKRKIEKWLESLEDKGFNIVVCTAIFSNGEARYSIRNKRAEMLAAVNA